MTYRTASRQGELLTLEKIAGLRSETARRLDFKENARERGGGRGGERKSEKHLPK